MVKENITQVQNAESFQMNTQRLSPRHIIIKMARVKGKERILTEGREKQLITEILQARGDRHKIFKIMKIKDL